MAGHNKEYDQHQTLERMRNIGLGWAGIALIFSWGLTLPLILAVGSQGMIEKEKHWAGFKSKLTQIFPGKKGHGGGH